MKVDKEKLIRAMEYCTADIAPVDENDECLGDVCPFKEGGYESGDCQENMIRAALALLRKQEPRVMTLEEAKGFRDKPVWLEENTPQGSYGAWGVMKGFHDKYNAVNIGGVRFTYWPRARYNIDWRCWTARPTEEQRKAVAWDG